LVCKEIFTYGKILLSNKSVAIILRILEKIHLTSQGENVMFIL